MHLPEYRTLWYVCGPGMWLWYNMWWLPIIRVMALWSAIINYYGRSSKERGPSVLNVGRVMSLRVVPG
jgi:hypothetical protein